MWIKAVAEFIYMISDWLSLNVYSPLKEMVGWNDEIFPFGWILTGVLVALYLIWWLIRATIKRFKKRKIKFFVGNKLVGITKTRYKKPIKFIELDESYGTFLGWYKNKKLTKEYGSEVLEQKKNLKLYAKVEVLEPQPVLVNNYKKQSDELEVEVKNNEVIQENIDNEVKDKTTKTTETINEPQVLPIVENNSILENNEPNIEDKKVEDKQVVDKQVVEEKVEILNDLGKYYDELRYNLLSYERTQSFKKMGVVSKQIIAEMFEFNGEINLYVNVSPELMVLKGFNVQKYESEDFKIVPCRKIVKNYADYLEAILLIKEVMTMNNLVKSEVVLAEKTVSDEKTRKSGFAFFVKNEVIASTIEDYYRLLRAIVLSYTISNDENVEESLKGKMILKIFKKKEKLFLYLALKEEMQNLQFVGYDKNFIDTPYMFEIKSTNDYQTALELIETLMSQNGLVKVPEKAEISLDDKIEENCGFGYRIKN